MRFSTCCRPGASGARCRPTCRRRARFTTISTCGTGTVRWSASITHSTSRSGSGLAGKPAPPSLSSTPRAPRGRKKGGVDRPVGFRRGQEGQRPQAPHLRRHPWLLAERRRPSRRYSGSRRGCRRAAASSAILSVRRAHLCRRRLPGAEDGEGCRQNRVVEARNRQALRPAPLRLLAQALDRRTDLRLDQSMPPPRQGLRTSRPQNGGLRPTGHDPHHASAPHRKSLIMSSNFSEGLSGLLAISFKGLPQLVYQHNFGDEHE